MRRRSEAMRPDGPVPAGRESRVGGHVVLFPLAAAHAALAVPIWLAGHLGWLPFRPPVAHAHEMLMGFALAVIGGFLLTRPGRGALALAVAAWTAGRLGAWLPLPGSVALLCGLAYPVVLFVLAGLPFLRAAKSPHNAVFGPLVGAFVPVELLHHLADDEGQAARAGLYLVALMLFTMGGRVIPAATAGALRAKGAILVARVQRPLEWLGIAAILAAGLFSASGALAWPAAAASVLGGAVAWARLLRWRMPAVLDRPELWSLHLGYAWLGGGLMLAGVQQVAPMGGAAGWHAVTIGALGTLAAAMMVRASLQRGRHEVVLPRTATVAIGLIGCAAALRLAAGAVAMVPLLAASAVLWSAAYLFVLAVLLRISMRRRSPISDRR